MRFPQFKQDPTQPPSCAPGAKWVKGFEGRYAVTKDGNIFSYAFGEARKLNPRPKKNGYYVVTFYVEKKPIYRYVHRLVAESFLGVVDGMQIDHIDMNRTNNQINNLEIVTQRENIRRQMMSNLTDVDILSIRRTLLPMGRSYKEIAAIYGVHKSTIKSIAQGQSWKGIV